jgi:hypothetical protein
MAIQELQYDNFPPVGPCNRVLSGGKPGARIFSSQLSIQSPGIFFSAGNPGLSIFSFQQAGTSTCIFSSASNLGTRIFSFPLVIRAKAYLPLCWQSRHKAIFFSDGNADIKTFSFSTEIQAPNIFLCWRKPRQYNFFIFQT